MTESFLRVWIALCHEKNIKNQAQTQTVYIDMHKLFAAIWHELGQT